jgi:hypothetical protein
LQRRSRLLPAVPDLGLGLQGFVLVMTAGVLALRGARLVAIGLALGLWLVSVPALAQIDEAMRLMEDADFQGAIAAFDRAEATATLDRPALLRLLSGRAMAAWATGDEAHARRDLVSLASIEPGYQLPPEAPPEVAAAFNEAVSETAPLAITARWETSDGAATLTTQTAHDSGGMVRSIRVHVREGSGPWRVETAPVVVPLAAGARAEAYVEAIGPGGVIVGAAGSEASPITTAAPIPSAALEGAPPPSDMTPIWIGVGVGVGAAVIVAVIITAVVLGGGASDTTQPRFPVVVGF